MDRGSGMTFLVDTGANISVIPPTSKQKLSGECSDYRLFAANDSEIKTYGVRTLDLNLNLRRPYRWTFVIADVNQPILGADFLEYHSLLVDLRSRKIVDRLTDLNVVGSIVEYNEQSIYTIVDTHPMYDLLKKYPDITKPVSFTKSSAHTVYHHIETTGPPVYVRSRPLPPDRYKKVKAEFQIMQDMGICRPSKSPWASPLHIVPKKNGELRPVGDYRRLNAITKPDRYPVPRLQDFTYVLGGKKIFSKIDINRAYHCIEVAPDDVEKTAIITPFGLFEFPRMSFGLRNAAQTFQRFMNTTVLQGLDFLFSYIDDVIVASNNETEHKEHLEIIFQRFNKYGITINLSKCDFCKTEIEFLGYKVTTEGIHTLDDKVKVIENLPKPETVEQLRRFLGMINFYRAHIPKAAENQAVLHSYIHDSKKRDKTKIVWTESAEKAFVECKRQLQQAVTLSHPLPECQLALFTDASDTCVGAVLQQFVRNKWQPLGYFSKKLSDAQIKYSTYDRELLAVYMAIQHFQNFIEGRELVIFTDHKPLTYAFSKKKSENEIARRTRQLLYISEFTTDIRHVSGEQNVVADCLSRIESINCQGLIDYRELAEEQSKDKLLQEIRKDETQFREIAVPTCDKSIVCNIEGSKVRPYLTEKFRKIAFNMIHNLSHAGIRTTKKMIANKYYWPCMNKEVGQWAKACIRCQRAKVHRHGKSELGTFPLCDRFEHIHVDIVGPLPTTPEGYRYLVTVIDRKTRWPEAFPIKEIHAETVAKAIYDGWIVRFGCPTRLTSDQGTQFESNLFQQMMKLLGINKIRTTSFHPQSNGKVERWHRSLKAALMARMNHTNWLQELGTVMFGLRVAPCEDTSISASQMVYGTNIRLPGEFFEDTQEVFRDEHEYVRQLRKVIGNLRSRPTRHHDSRSIFLHPDLKTCDQVFVRNDTVRKALQPPYDGPYSVISRGDKHFLLKMPNRKARVSIDRLKPAYTLRDPQLTGQESTENKQCVEQKMKNVKKTLETKKKVVFCEPAAAPKTWTTRSGRVIKTPTRYV